MSETVRDVMTTDLYEVGLDESLVQVAQLMRDNGIGDVLVVDGGQLRGIVTDRDIVVRAIADGLDPTRETADTVYSGLGLATVTPETGLDEAARLMREKSVRRLPVVDNGRPVGMVTIGDLAIERDYHSALADISVAPPNE
jgi:CBS domain-containing protein